MKAEINEIVANLLYLILTGILPLVALYVVQYIKAAVRKATADTDDMMVREALYYASEALERIVVSVNQTYVESLKSVGKFDKAAQAKAKSMALQKAQEVLTDEAKAAIINTYGSLSGYLEFQIESLVNENKAG